MKTIFKSVITSERHRKIGFCEKSDFGHISLIELHPEEKELVVSFDEYDEKKEFIKYKNIIYSKLNKSSYLGGVSREDENEILKKQGKFSQQSALNLVLELRERLENWYSCVSSMRFLLISKTLYTNYCKEGELKITVCGNLSFANWLSINIEAEHGGKNNHNLNKKEFYKTVKEQYQRWLKNDPNTKSIDGKTLSLFSKPKNVKWGKDYL